MSPATVMLVMTQLSDREAALNLAQVLIDERLAACVSVGQDVTSVYRWAGAVETANEIPLLIKTTSERYAALQTRVRELHPYELPEIIAVPLAQGLPEYLQWVVDEVTAP